MAKIVINECHGGFGLSKIAIAEYWKRKGVFPDKNWYEGDLVRDDPILISVVEDLGENANGEYAKLTVEEMPDGVPWYVDDYDGYETLKVDPDEYEDWAMLAAADEGMKGLLDRCRVYYTLKVKENS